MRLRRALACALVPLGMAPAAAAAQGRTCDLVRQADQAQLVNARGETIIYFRDPVRLRCTGGVTLEADSAIYNRTLAAMELVGSVVYRDTTTELTSDWANYLGRLEQLLARGNVVLTDLRDGSVITGDELQYLREMPGRPEAHVIMRGVRPRAVIREAPVRDPGPAPALPPPDADTAAPVIITADRLELLGDTLFLARGNVDLERGATTGAADSARYHQVGERLVLLGQAHVRDERYRLEGDRIDALVTGETLREVMAEGRTSLASDELTVRSERLRIGFVQGALDRLEAWNPPATTPDGAVDSLAPLPERALAIAEDFRLRADSIDAVADSGRLREVRAVNRAYGERSLDSLAIRVHPVAARDWIQGDTIIGYFADAPLDTAVVLAADDAVPGAAEAEPARPDSTEVVLERVVVIGGTAPALSLYRMEPETEGEEGAINFMKAKRIILFMADGEVARVEAEGPIDGLYLDPLPPAQTPGSGSGGPR